MAVVRKSTLRVEVIKLDPDWPLKSKRGPEYEFDRPDGTKRTFNATYANRGVYGETLEEWDHPQGDPTPTPSDP